MRRWIITAVALLGGSTACGYDSSGLGSASGATPNSGGNSDGTSGSTESTGADDLEDADGSGDPDDGSTGDSADSSGTSGPADSTGDTGPMPVDCENPPLFVAEFDASDAILEPPMALGNNSDEGRYAYSEVANQGRASFPFTVPCLDEYWVFARVYDPGVGATGLDAGEPDSFGVAFDDDVPAVWLYGCQTWDMELGGWLWAWLPVVSHAVCIEDSFRKTLGAGTHVFHLGNREAGNHQPLGGDYIGEVAAVSRVVITNDPNWSL